MDCYRELFEDKFERKVDSILQKISYVMMRMHETPCKIMGLFDEVKMSPTVRGLLLEVISCCKESELLWKEIYRSAQMCRSEDLKQVIKGIKKLECRYDDLKGIVTAWEKITDAVQDKISYAQLHEEIEATLRSVDKLCHEYYELRSVADQYINVIEAETKPIQF